MQTNRDRVNTVNEGDHFINMWPYLSVVEKNCNNKASKKSYER